jgi:hypothetical protein
MPMNGRYLRGAQGNVSQNVNDIERMPEGLAEVALVTLKVILQKTRLLSEALEP